jgi:hypothetical protein
MTTTRHCFAIALIGLLLAAAGPHRTASAAPTNTDELRLELRDFLIEMRRLPAQTRDDVYQGEVDFEQAIADVDHLDDEELRVLARVLTRLPEWRRMPAVLAASVADEPVTARGTPTALIETSEFRFRWLAALDSVAESARREGSAELADSASALATRLAMADRAELAELELALVDRLPRMRDSLRGGGSTKGAAPAIAKSASCSCDPSTLDFPEDVFCWIEKIGCEVSELPGVVATEMQTFIEGVFGDLESALADAGLLLPRVESGWDGASSGFVGLMSTDLGVDFDDPDWYLGLLDLLPDGLLIACPDVGTDLGIFDGEVGSVRGAYDCKRQLDWVASAIYESTPDDIFSVPVKLVLAFLYYPVNHLCLCMEAQWQVEYDGLQGVHRDEFDADVVLFTGTDGRFKDDPVDLTDTGVKISNRATQLSVDESRARVAGLDASVVVLTSKADTLQAGLDDLQDGDDEQLELIRSLASRELQLRIESNLTDDHPDAISLFQMPESVGGRLELVEEIVAETIDAAAARGENVNQALRRRDRALQHYLAGDYKLAYDALRAAYRSVLR